MPLREFKCSEGHITEEILDVNNECPHTRCILCGRVADRIDLSSSSFRLSPGGSGGFYKPSSS